MTRESWLRCACVQQRLPLNVSPAAADLRQLAVNGREYPVTIARHHRARRYVLRIAPDGGLRLTVPRGASVSRGLAFAARQADWIERECARVLARTDWRIGSTILFRGERVGLRRAGRAIAFGDQRIPLNGSDDVKAIVEARLSGLASTELPDRCRELARSHGLVPDRVSVRAQRSRWGACSARRRITLNWRLIQTPPYVSDYVILHELAHLRVRNHSDAFWREVERLCPWWREGEAWLRRRGREVL